MEFAWHIDPASQDSMYALAAALTADGSRVAFKLTRKSHTKKCKESPGYRISERVSFILNVPHGWKFSGKVAIGTVIPEHVLLNQHLELRTGFLKEI